MNILRDWQAQAAADSRLITYQLAIRLESPQRIQVGRLGCFDFPAGHYVYTGSARRNLPARVQRHLSSEKKLRWHIDYLLANPSAQIVEVKLFRQGECELNKQLAGNVIVPRFGASDCRRACGSHLKYLGAE